MNDLDWHTRSSEFLSSTDEMQLGQLLAIATGIPGLQLLESALHGQLAGWASDDVFVYLFEKNHTIKKRDLGVLTGFPGVVWVAEKLLTKDRFREIFLSHDKTRRQMQSQEALMDLEFCDVVYGFAGLMAICSTSSPDFMSAIRVCPRDLHSVYQYNLERLNIDRTDAAGGRYVDFGFAHGVCGLIASVVKARRNGTLDRLEASALEELKCILEQDAIQRYDNEVMARTSTGTNVSDSLGWCYGPLSYLLAQSWLYQVGMQHQSRTQLIDEILGTCRLEKPTRGLNICHGAAGVSHSLSFMARVIGSPEVGDLAIDWHAVLLQKSRELKNSDLGERGYSGFLGGASGVLLSCIQNANTTDFQKLQWQDLLLLDCAR
jgi:lantibiotic modifying enzyme